MRTESDKRTVYKTDCSDSISLKNAYKEGKEILAKAGITEADLDAWYLLEFVTGITKARYYMDPDQSMDPEAWKKYKEYLEKRRNHIPLQHITGSQEFMGLEFLVNEHVLIPRQDTEVLVEEALEMMKQEIFRSKGCLQLLDMCTGSGCILLSVMHYAEQKGIFIEGTGVDFSEQALMVAQKNEKHLRSTKKDENGKVNWILSDLFENVSETYDMILSNPPYIRTAEIEKLQDEVKLHDPFSALDGKEDGLYFYRKIVTDAKQFLKTGGVLAFEIGYDQGKEVSDLMKKAGYDTASLLCDTLLFALILLFCIDILVSTHSRNFDFLILNDQIPSNVRAFSLVTEITSSSVTSFSSAIIRTTYGRFRDEFLFPLFGFGARYGLSVSRTIWESGAYFTTSFNFFAFSKVTTPPIPR